MFENGARGTFEAVASMVGPESQNSFEVYGTKGAVAWNFEKMNELRVYIAARAQDTGFTTVFGGDRFPPHGNFVPGSANSIGFEDLIASRTTSSCSSVARRRAAHAGLHGGACTTSRVQDAVLRSWESGRWEDVVHSSRRTADEDHPSHDGAGDRPLPDRPADGDRRREVPLFAGVFAIFGHGNVTCLGPALEAVKETFPTWRGQNEQGMALAAVAFAKAMRRRQIMVATSSIGPGATNMVTAAAVAHANRLPVLLLSGDTFASRIPDPVLQQVEQLPRPTVTVNDAFKPVTRYWDRIIRPEQIVHSLPHAVATMLDPADCGPVFLGLPQDVQAEAYDYPDRFFEPTRAHRSPGPVPTAASWPARPRVLCQARKPLIIAGGGVHYSLAEDALRAFAERHHIPVVETVAGKATLVADPPAQRRPHRRRPAARRANAMAAEADVVLAVGTRLQDFTTGSWTVFANDAANHRAQHRHVRRREAPRASARRRRPRGPSRARRRSSATGGCRTTGPTARHVEIAPTTTRTSTRSPARPRRRSECRPTPR